MTTRTVAAVLTLILALPALCQQVIHGKVISVTDGDTIGILIDQREVKIRLHGIDCPEGGQAFGSRAKQFTSDTVFGKVVQVQVTDTDKYGRTVGIVATEEGKVLNHELLRRGLAWWYQQYAPNEKDLARLQGEAMMARRGLWSEPTPIAPWAFRQGHTGDNKLDIPPMPPRNRGIEIVETPPSTRQPFIPPPPPVAQPRQRQHLYDQQPIQHLQTAPQADVPRYKVPTTSVESESYGPTASQGYAPAVPQYQAPQVLVYATRTGSKYHRDGCRHLSQSKIPISLSDAQAQGLGPCSVCRP